jgi:hypothetical protein
VLEDPYEIDMGILRIKEAHSRPLRLKNAGNIDIDVEFELSMVSYVSIDVFNLKIIFILLIPSVRRF